MLKTQRKNILIFQITLIILGAFAIIACDAADHSSDSTSSTSETLNTITVTTNGSSDYVFNGIDRTGTISGNDINIQINLGDTLTFNVDVGGHPFLINTQGTRTGTAASGVTNNEATSGAITFVPAATGTYYYNCTAHSGMTGTITVTE